MKKINKGMIYYTNINNKNKYKIIVLLQDYINSDIVLVAPIVKIDNNYQETRTHIRVKEFDRIRPNSFIILEQMLPMHLNNLKGYVCKINDNDLQQIDNILF